MEQLGKTGVELFPQQLNAQGCLQSGSQKVLEVKNPELKVREGSGRFRRRSCRLRKFCRVLDIKMSFTVSLPEEKAVLQVKRPSGLAAKDTT